MAGKNRGLSRRQLVRGAAWAVPAVALARPTEAVAAPSTKGSFARYLALGDSIANGEQVPNYWPYPAIPDGYASLVAARLQQANPNVTVPYVDLACNGETATTYLDGGCQWCPEYPLGWGQEDAAVQYLRTAEGKQTRWVSIGLGYNDIGPYAGMGRYQTGVDLGGVREVLDTVTAPRLTKAVRGIKALVPQARIALVGYHDPNLAVNLVHPDASESFRQDSITAWGWLHDVIRAVAQQQKVRYADVPAVFLDAVTTSVDTPCCGVQEQRVAKICEYAWVCADGDGHPNNAGYTAYADAVTAALLA